MYKNTYNKLNSSLQNELKALDVYYNYYEGFNKNGFTKFLTNYKRSRRIMMSKKPCLKFVNLSYTRGYGNNYSKRFITSQYSCFDDIINVLLNIYDKKITTHGIGMSHCLNIFDTLCYKLNFNGCCDSKISQSNYIQY